MRINSWSTENKDFIKWAIGYFADNTNFSFDDFKNQFLTPLEITKNPLDDNWNNTDDVIFYDPDQQTTYQEYQDSQTWPTINRIIPFEQFVPMRLDAFGRQVNCKILADEQLGKAGYKVTGHDPNPNGQTFQCYTEAAGANISKTKQGISYIISAMQQGIPVELAVDNRPGTPSSVNIDNSTDHFIVIVAMGTDGSGKFFQFLDSSTSNPIDGVSYNNRLYYNSNTGKIIGKTRSPYGALAGSHDYIVTQIRKSIKK